MKACQRCRGPNTTMSGLCVSCLVWAATQKAMQSHECAERLRAMGSTPIRKGIHRDPRSVPVAGNMAGKEIQETATELCNCGARLKPLGYNLEGLPAMVCPAGHVTLRGAELAERESRGVEG